MQICQTVSKLILFPNSLWNDTAHKEKSGKSPLWFLEEHIGGVSSPAMAGWSWSGGWGGGLAWRSKAKTLRGDRIHNSLKCSSGKTLQQSRDLNNNNATNHIFLMETKVFKMWIEALKSSKGKWYPAIQFTLGPYSPILTSSYLHVCLQVSLGKTLNPKFLPIVKCVCAQQEARTL